MSVAENEEDSVREDDGVLERLLELVELEELGLCKCLGWTGQERPKWMNRLCIGIGEVKGSLIVYLAGHG